MTSTTKYQVVMVGVIHEGRELLPGDEVYLTPDQAELHGPAVEPIAPPKPQPASAKKPEPKPEVKADAPSK